MNAENMSNMLHLAALDSTFVSASISYPVMEVAPVIKVTTQFKDPSVVLNDVINQYPNYSYDSFFQFYFGRATGGLTKAKILETGMNQSFSQYQFVMVPLLNDTRITIPSAFYYIDCLVDTFSLDATTGICTLVMQYVFMPSGEPTLNDTIAAVQLFSYAPVLDSIQFSDAGTTNPDIYLSNGGDHMVDNTLANASLPSDIYFIPFSDFDGNSREYTSSDLVLSGE